MGPPGATSPAEKRCEHDQLVTRAGPALLGDVVILVRDTLAVFVRLFPQIMAVWLLGWLGNALAVRVAAIVGDASGWAAVVVFSSSFSSPSWRSSSSCGCAPRTHEDYHARTTDERCRARLRRPDARGAAAYPTLGGSGSASPQ
ncbi:MAG: hypothetical protein ACRYG2_10580 [Janthinobacterium lividum]